MFKYLFIPGMFLLSCVLSPYHAACQTLGKYQSHVLKPHQADFKDTAGNQLRLKAYSNGIIRVQAARRGEDFLSDDHYEMVASHTLTGIFKFTEKAGHFNLSNADGSLIVRVNRNPLSVQFANGSGKVLLKQAGGTEWNRGNISTRFVNDSTEHFCGLGHQAFGLVPSIDLQGQTARSNYGDYDYNVDDDGWLAQAFLVVPFYMSARGYGVFVNSTFANHFSFGKNGDYSIHLKTKGFAGQMDYFFIAGPHFRSILNRYTQLTGRPRLPQRSIFGLHLSDKDTPENEGMNWWKNAVKKHRAAGYPLDHIVNDNRWRAGSGAWSGSWFEWDKTRYPDPAAYKKWVDSNGLTMTLDHNRNNGSLCWGWKPSFNMPGTSCVKESYAVPDYSSSLVRNWIWSLFWKKSLDPSLKFPGDALWMDEIDELLCIPDSAINQDGRNWAENRNYYPFLVAKAVVQEGWDNTNKNQPPGIGEARRPFMWGRGSTAGAQRYATHWSGDLRPSYTWMRKTIRGMLASGLSGFPFFNHDAGGFREPGPDDTMYVKWAMAMGSFSPVWRPHGVSGSPRWPLNRSALCQKAATTYAHIRYETMPYIYSSAYTAYATGTPMARAMVIDYQNNAEAWSHDLQYMWGDNMLVAPQTTTQDSTYSIWLPPGNAWYYYWNDSLLNGGQVTRLTPPMEELPVFIKSGSIIPRYPYATSTFWLDNRKLTLDVYSGKDGTFTLYEDDGVTEKYKTRNERALTLINYNDAARTITIHPVNGTYAKAPIKRSYKIILHGGSMVKAALVNGYLSPVTRNEGKRTFTLLLTDLSVHKKLVIQLL